MAIKVTLRRVMLERNLSLCALSAKIGLSVPNLCVLKNGRAKAMRFSTLARLCRALDCQPRDLLEFRDAP